MARFRRKKGSSRRSKKIPVLATAGVAVFALNAYNGYMGKAGSQGGGKGIAWTTLGIDNGGNFQVKQFAENMLPLVAGIGGSALAAKFKMNRYISGIPLFKL